MSVETLQRAFHKMGARVAFTEGSVPRNFRNGAVGEQLLSLNVRRDKFGEYFTVSAEKLESLMVLDVQQKDRHLLLMSKEDGPHGAKHRYLLGHDERHWFVAGVPESTPVSTVRDAKLALKPREVLRAEIGLKTSAKNQRRNKARVRQGEWFFIPDPYFIAPKGWKNTVLYDEPLVRSNGGKPHICEELYRSGGETVYVSGGAYASGLTEDQYAALGKQERERHNWQQMKRDMDVWVRGTVRHSDHATIKLNDWCRVYSNTEHLSFAMRNIRFLD
jgi:hypothetical protein